MRVCTLGDLLLDVVVRLPGPIALDTDTYGETHVGAGGQAANVAAWVAALGGEARFLGKRGRDAVGRIVAEELGRHGVEVEGPLADGRTGTVVSLATPDGRRSMLSDRGVAVDFAPEELDPGRLADVDVLHVPGYSLAVPPLRETALRAAALAPRVTVDVSSTAAVRGAGVTEFRALVARVAPAVVFANEEEAELVGQLDVETLVVKRGARGCLVRGPEGEREYPALPVDEVVDTTGAGDAFAAGWLLGGVEPALAAAARCVRRLGTMP